MTKPASDSISESKPKPMSAIEPAAIPAPSAIANSTACQAFPPQASRRARRTSRARRSAPSAGTSGSGCTVAFASATAGLVVADVLQADLEQQSNVRVVERVVDVAPLLAVAHEPARAQQAQVVRARRLRETGHRSEVADAQFPGLEQRRDQAHPARIG